MTHLAYEYYQDGIQIGKHKSKIEKQQKIAELKKDTEDVKNAHIDTLKINKQTK